MLRYLVMTFAWLFFSCTAMAEESNIGKALIVENNEGAKSVFLLKDYVNISFAHKQMSVRTNINDTIIDVKEICRMYFDYVEIDTGVEKCYQDTIKVIFKPTKIIIENIDENYPPPVTIYSLKGSRLSQRLNTKGLYAEIDIQHLPTGVYLVQIGKRTYKFRKS